MWLFVMGCDAPKDPPTNPPADEDPVTPPDTTPTNCVAGTIDGSGGSLADDGIRVVFPPDGFGPGVSSDVMICRASVPSGATPLSGVWDVVSGVALVLPATVELTITGPPESAAMFVPDPSGNAVHSFQQVLGADLLSAPLYRDGTVYAALDDRVLVPYAAAGITDVLFVVDNSCSMVDDQAKLANTFSQVFDVLDDVDTADFHIGVVSTDLDDPQHSGKPIPEFGVRWIDPLTLDPDAVFSAMARLGDSGSGVEQGIGAAWSAIELEGDATNAGFFRDDSTLAVAVVSDEPDSTRRSIVEQQELEAYLLALPTHPDVQFHSLVDPNFGQAYTATTAAVGGAVTNIADNDWRPWMESVLDGMRIWMDLDPQAADEPEAWWLPVDGSEQQRIPGDQVRADAVTVTLDTTGFGPEGAIWLLYPAAAP